MSAAIAGSIDRKSRAPAARPSRAARTDDDMTTTAIVLLIGLIAAPAGAAFMALLHRRRSIAGVPRRSAVLVKCPAAVTSLSEGEVIVSLRGMGEGLALNAVAARCWELIDGSRTLVEIARQIQAEHKSTLGEALREARAFAGQIKEALFALERSEWDLIHVHRHDVFAGGARAEDGSIVERRLCENLIVHAAACLVDASGAVAPWRGSALQRRKALSRMKDLREREAPLERAARDLESGWEHCVAGNLKDAEADFRRCVDQAPGWAHAQYQLGYVLMRLGQYDEAAEFLERTEAISPGHYMVREYLDQARRLAAGHLLHEAFLLFDRANATGLRDPDATIMLASRALEINPVYPSARLILARAYQKKAQLEKALTELSRTIQMGPDQATLCHALCSRGTIFMAQGQTQEAVREWEKVIEINGSAAATRSALANLASSPRVN